MNNASTAGAGDRFRVGDRVMAHVMPLTQLGGAYAEHVNVQARWTVHVPRGVDLIEAATLPMNGMTALDAVEKAGAGPGTTIGVIGAAGAVGGLAVQLAKSTGARVIAVAAVSDTADVQQLGADVVVPRGTAVVDRLRSEVADGLDGLVDTVGTDPALIAAVRRGGAYVAVAGDAAAVGADLAARASVTTRWVNVSEIPDPERMLERIRALAEAGAVSGRIDRIYTPEDAGAAHRRLARGGSRGRQVLKFSD